METTAAAKAVSADVSERKEKVPRKMGLCQEGFPFIALGLALSLVAGLIWGVHGAWLPLLLTGFVTWFFRNPIRVIPMEAGQIVSPGDGRILEVVPESFPCWRAEPATRISIFLSIFNVHVNRIPHEGIVEQVEHLPGKFRAAFSDKASKDNERTTVLVQTAFGQPIIFSQIAGWIARRIVCRLSPQEKVARGEKFGLIRFGSRVDIYLPKGTEICVRPGQRVKGGEDILGVWHGR